MGKYLTLLWLIFGTITFAADPNFEDYATIEGVCDGIPIYSLGNITYIYGVSPTFLPNSQIQADNINPKTKIIPKKSWQIKSNYAGAYPAQPSVRTAWNDSQPFLPIHLIDGDPDTAWCSYGNFYSDGREEWIRIDLPVETTITSVALVSSQRFALGNTKGYILSTEKYEKDMVTDWMGVHRWAGRALPKELKIQVSTDGYKWQSVYETKDLAGSEKGETVIKFASCKAKQVLISANNFKHIIDKYVGYAFSIGELEIFDQGGSNVAIISKGAGVTVSSTSYLMNHDRLTQQICFAPVIYDLGLKWVTICADEGLQCWKNVERIKGKFEMDPDFDKMITDFTRKGVNVWMSLDVKANPIYLGRKLDWKKARYSEINNTYYDMSGWAYSDPNLRQPYMRYLEFVINHFKGRVKMYNIGADWPGDKTVTAAICQLIRKIDPQAGISDSWSQGSVNDINMWMPGYPSKRIDAGGGFDELESLFRMLPDVIKAKRKEGYRGLMNTCLMTWSNYPPGPTPPGKEDFIAVKDEFGFIDYKYWCESEIARAKFVAQAIIGFAGLDTITLYCNPYFSSCAVGQSLFRVPVPNCLINPMQPDAGYYVLRTINTVLDEYKPEKFEVKVDSKKDLFVYTFKKNDNNRMVAMWIPGKTGDKVVEEKNQIIIPNIKAKNVSAVDLFNGTEQKLNFNSKDDGIIIEDIMVKDYPVIIVIQN